MGDWWDLGFLIWGAIMLLGGWALVRAGEAEQGAVADVRGEQRAGLARGAQTHCPVCDLTVAVAQVVFAHLIGESWHIADLLLYGGASLGLILGIGLFLRGRVERVRNTGHADEGSDGDGEREPLLRTPEVHR